MIKGFKHSIETLTVMRNARATTNTEKARAGQRRRFYKYAEKNRQKVNARRMVLHFIDKGLLKKEPCFCGNPITHAHHDDYSKPSMVVWLCDKHHRERHKSPLYKLTN